MRVPRVARLAAELEVDADLAPGLGQPLEDQLRTLLPVLRPVVLLLVDPYARLVSPLLLLMCPKKLCSGHIMEGACRRYVPVLGESGLR